MTDDREQLAVWWLKTIGAATADTIQCNPNVTIAPSTPRRETARKYAFAVLQRLAARSTDVQIQKTLGQGGMGVVHMASQVALGRTVAVKTLRADRRSDETTLNLLREAWITGSLEHPNVVPVHDVGLDQDGHPLIILKRIEGVPWNQLMHDADTVREQFDASDLLTWNLEIFSHVINAVRFAHSRGIVHRDLKPENVMIGEFGEVYVLDWGIAVSLHDDDSGRLPLASEATEIAGTPCYMAPEMLGEGVGSITERTDIYLLGGLLYEIVAGSPPHPGDTVFQIIRSVVVSDPRFPEDAPDGLVRICRRAMAADADDRHGSVDELRSDVLRYLEYRGSARLAQQAEQRLDVLAELLSRDRSVGDIDDAVWRQNLYRAFGACRFGFREALSAWDENPAARKGLSRAITLMAEHELESGRPRAAEALMAELSQPPEDLQARIRAAVRALENRGERMAELEKLSADLDLGAGARTRNFIAALIATFWIALPLSVQFLGYRTSLTHENSTLTALVFFLFAAGLFIWARESMTRTAVNRRVIVSIVILCATHMAFEWGCWSLGLDLRTTMPFYLLLWAFTAAMLAVMVESVVWMIAIGFLLGFAIAVWQPDWVLYCMSGSNLVMLVTVSWVSRRYRHLYAETQTESEPG